MNQRAMWKKVVAVRRCVRNALGTSLSYQFRTNWVCQAYTSLCDEARIAYQDGELNLEIVSQLEEYALKVIALKEAERKPAPIPDI